MFKHTKKKIIYTLIATLILNCAIPVYGASISPEPTLTLQPSISPTESAPSTETTPPSETPSITVTPQVSVTPIEASPSISILPTVNPVSPTINPVSPTIIPVSPTATPQLITGTPTITPSPIPSKGKADIVPNKLTIKWNDKSNPDITIDTIRILDYNVAQLRTMVSACGGTVLNLDDQSYQVVTSSSYKADFSDIGFNSKQNIDYELNLTKIRDSSGAVTTPTQPGWVFLPKFEYNWGSIRDILQVLGLELVSFTDDPTNAKTEVIISKPGTVTTTTNTTTTTAGDTTTTTATDTTTSSSTTSGDVTSTSTNTTSNIEITPTGTPSTGDQTTTVAVMPPSNS